MARKGNDCGRDWRRTRFGWAEQLLETELDSVILLMVQKSVDHQLKLVDYPHYLQASFHPRWFFGISEPSTVLWSNIVWSVFFSQYSGMEIRIKFCSVPWWSQTPPKTRTKIDKLLITNPGSDGSKNLFFQCQDGANPSTFCLSNKEIQLIHEVQLPDVWDQHRMDFQIFFRFSSTAESPLPPVSPAWWSMVGGLACNMCTDALGTCIFTHSWGTGSQEPYGCTTCWVNTSCILHGKRIHQRAETS